MLWKGNFLFGFAVWKNFRCRQTLIPSSMLPDKEAASINAAIFRCLFFFKYITRGLLTFSFTSHFMPCSSYTFKAVPPAWTLWQWGSGPLGWEREAPQCPQNSEGDIWKLLAMGCPYLVPWVIYVILEMPSSILDPILKVYDRLNESHLKMKADKNLSALSRNLNNRK